MQASALPLDPHFTPRTPIVSAVTELRVLECDRDVPLVSVPRAEIQIVVRFGSMARRGLDAHAFGARQTAHRKRIRRGQRSLTARLHLGASEAVLGVSASAMAERIVPLEDLWGYAATERLLDRLAGARDLVDASSILNGAIADRLAVVGSRRARAHLALEAAARLTKTHVRAVAGELGVSERQLRRVFREAVGVSPKTFAKLARFHRALRAAETTSNASWASIAADAGYYDQAHLIAEFRAITGVTPRELLREVRAVRGPGVVSCDLPMTRPRLEATR